MEMISLKKKFEFFQDTLNLCGLFLLSCSDEDIEYYLFEEFDGDCISFLHEATLELLLNEKLISERVFYLSLELSKQFRKLENTALWNARAVKEDKKWFRILTLSDEIKKMLRSETK